MAANEPKKPNFNKNNNASNPKRSFNFYWIYAIIAIGFIAVQFYSSGNYSREISPNEFFDIAERGYVEKINIIRELLKEQLDASVNQRQKMLEANANLNVFLKNTPIPVNEFDSDEKLKAFILEKNLE